MKYDRLEEYLSSIDELSKKYSNQCTILKGFECEYYPNHIDTIIG